MPPTTMTVADAIRDFTDKARTGQVVNERKGMLVSITPNQRNVILSAVRRAVRRAASTSNFSMIPFAAVAQMLPEHARFDAIEHGRGSGNDEASKVRRFVRTVEGRAPKVRRSRTHNFLPAWRELADALTAWESRRETRANLKSKLHMLMELVSTRGRIDRPEDLPDRDTIRSWANSEGNSQEVFHKMLHAYRAARAEVARTRSDHGLPDVDQSPLTSERGIRSLACITEVAAQIGHLGPIAKLDTMAALRVIAPLMHSALTAYIEANKASGGSAAWEKGVAGAVSRVVASAVRTGVVNVKRLPPAALFLQMVEGTGNDGGLADYERATLAFYGDEAGEGGATHEIPLIQFLSDEMAASSARNSPASLKSVVQRTIGEDDVPFYTKAIMGDVDRLASLARFTMERSRKGHPERYAAIGITAKAVLDSMAKVNRERGVVGRVLNKGRSLELATYPLVVCMGLPALAEEVRRYQAGYFEAVERHEADLDHSSVRDAAERYDEWLERYVATAIYIADGLREKNYTYARIGAEGVRARMVDERGHDVEPTLTHIWPELDPVTGEVARVRTHFCGSDHRLARLKIRFEADGETFRDRIWHIRPGIMDMSLFTEFLLGTRARRLAAQGLITSVDEYNLERDVKEWNFALFVSTERSTHHYRQITGAYSDSMLGSMVGGCMHWMAKNVFGHTDLPEYGTREWAKQYHRVLTGHFGRSMIASYWRSIRDRTDLACEYINDTEDTLRSKYARVTTQQLDAEFIGQLAWRRPDFFDAEIDRIWFKGEVINWSEESPLLSLPRKERPAPLV